MLLFIIIIYNGITEFCKIKVNAKQNVIIFPGGLAHLCAWQFHIFLYIREDRSLTGLYFVTHFVQFCHKLEWTKQWKYRHQINQRNYILKHLRKTREIIILCQESTWKHQHFPLPNTHSLPQEGQRFHPRAISVSRCCSLAASPCRALSEFPSLHLKFIQISAIPSRGNELIYFFFFKHYVRAWPAAALIWRASSQGPTVTFPQAVLRFTIPSSPCAWHGLSLLNHPKPSLRTLPVWKGDICSS